MRCTIRKDSLRLPARIVFGAAIAIAACHNANADFVPFTIRNASAGGAAPVINSVAGGGWEFVISEGGQKAALGSNDINGTTVGNILSVKITRTDDHTRFNSTPPANGQYTAPYLNLWVTDGLGDFAILSDVSAELNGKYDNGYDFSFADLSGMTAWVYETSNSAWLANGGGHTFADFASLTIQGPTAFGWAGTGAPHVLGTNVTYGVNWVFGDTLSNYVSGGANDVGYIVSDAGAAAVPEPGSVVLFLTVLGGIGVMSRRRGAKA
jgi:hypothetical protein